MNDAKHKAHLAVTLERARGRFPRPQWCEFCGEAGRQLGHVWSLVLHHWSYAPEHWLDVTALCRACHARVHSGEIPEPTPHLYADPRVTDRSSTPAPARRGTPAPERLALTGEELDRAIIDEIQHGPARSSVLHQFGAWREVGDALRRLEAEGRISLRWVTVPKAP